MLEASTKFLPGDRLLQSVWVIAWTTAAARGLVDWRPRKSGRSRLRGFTSARARRRHGPLVPAPIPGRLASSRVALGTNRIPASGSEQ